MSKLAVLVLSHRIKATQCLVDVLDERFSVFVHVDARVSLEQTPLRPKSNVSVLTDRYRIFWGGFNMIRATRALLSEARAKNSDVQRFLLISGDALPTAQPETIESLLLDPEAEYIDLHPVQWDPSLRNATYEASISRYGWVQPWRFQNFSLWDHVLTCPRTVNDISPEYGLDPETAKRIRNEVHYLTRDVLERLPPRKMLFDHVYFGSQWWALSAEAIDLILSDIFDPEVEEYFRYLEVPDEHFFHCLIGRRLDDLERRGKRVKGSIMFTDNADPVRAAFTGNDALSVDRFQTIFGEIRRPFARKFDPDRASAITAAIRAGTYFKDIIRE